MICTMKSTLSSHGICHYLLSSICLGVGWGRERHGFRVVSFYANHLEPAVPGLEPLDASVLGNIVVTGSRV